MMSTLNLQPSWGDHVLQWSVSITMEKPGRGPSGLINARGEVTVAQTTKDNIKLILILMERNLEFTIGNTFSSLCF